MSTSFDSVLTAFFTFALRLLMSTSFDSVLTAFFLFSFGALKLFSLLSCLLPSAAACFSFFSAFFLAFLSASFKKYSPVSSSLSTFESGWAGGKGVYAFFSLFFKGCFLLDKFLCSNLGRNLSQFSFFSLGSFINSLLIIKDLML